MSVEAVCRICRREGMKLYLKGTRCETEKCAFERRSYAPGQHGQKRKKDTEYGLQLREKQKVKEFMESWKTVPPPPLLLHRFPQKGSDRRNVVAIARTKAG